MPAAGARDAHGREIANFQEPAPSLRPRTDLGHERGPCARIVGRQREVDPRAVVVGALLEEDALLVRDVMHKIVAALRVGGVFTSQDGALQGAEKTEAILAGLVESAEGMTKPAQEEPVSIPLKFGRKKAAAAAATNGASDTTSANGAVQAVNADGSVPLNLHRTNPNNKRKSPSPAPAPPQGVGFVDFSADLDDPIITGEDDDDELIDEDDLITEEDMARPVIQRTSQKKTPPPITLPPN